MADSVLTANPSIVQRAQRIRQTVGSTESETRGPSQKDGLYIKRPLGQVPLDQQKPGSYVRMLPKQELVVSPDYNRKIAGRLLFYGIVAAAAIVLIVVLQKAGLFSF